ncbi:MAG: hypothetical protein ABDH49_02420, partial [Candidatus Hydrothermales bacterium]
ALELFHLLKTWGFIEENKKICIKSKEEIPETLELRVNLKNNFKFIYQKEYRFGEKKLSLYSFEIKT